MDHPLDHRLRNALTGGIALCGVGLVSLGAACSSSSAGASADGGPSIPDAAAFPPAQGCHPERAATSYAGGATASTAKTAPTSGAPTACLTLTGQGAAESSL